MTKTRRDHVARVQAWLNANVRAYDTPRTLTLSQVSLDPATLGGSALLTFDSATSGEELTLGLEGDGWLNYGLPMFVSPLGAPASFAAIELSQVTQRVLQAAVRSLLPRLLPFGLHPQTKAWITQSTPGSLRTLEPAQFEAALERLARPGFALTWPVTPST